MPTLNQLILHSREEKWHTDRTQALDQCPQKQKVRSCVSTKTLKKPNSARKIAKVWLSNRHDIFAHILGEGHNLQEHSMVLIRGGRVKDSQGMKSHCVRGVKDLLGILDRIRGRSKYGAEKLKLYEWKMPLSLVFLGQSKEQPQCYAPKLNYTKPFRMTSHGVYYTSHERVY